MIRVKTFVSIVLTTLIFACQPSFEKEWKCISPDNSCSVVVSLNQNNEIMYCIKKGSQNMINWSKLGLKLKEADFSGKLSFVSMEMKSNIEDNYTLSTGKQLNCQSVYNTTSLTFKNVNDEHITIEFRAYNDGIAFRYRLANENQSYTVQEELTEFSVNPIGKAWMQNFDWWSPAYEALYDNKIYIGKMSQKHGEDGWAFPALFEIENEHWMLITEANNDRNYCASHIRNTDESPVYKVCFSNKEMAWTKGIFEPEFNTPWVSPWRVLIIGDLGTIVESNLVTDVSDANKLDNTEWIQPGRAAWSWLYEPLSPKDYNKLVKYVDLAAEMNWEHCLVDANWNVMKNGDIEQLIDYAETKNVGIILWYNSGGPHNTVTEMPRDLMHDPEARKKEFEKIHNWGVKGVKIDFFQSDKQDIMQLYIDILEDAAEYEILVNFHGSTLPRGWRRTYPHLVSMEAVKGSEWYLFDKSFTYVSGRHNAILPYTRNVIGPMDFTPVCFSQNKVLHVTSHAHELALSVAFESGVTHFGDKAEAFLALPEKVKDFLKEVPATWDETKFLGGYPGKSFMVARRKGNDWYVGAINGYYFDEDMDVDLSFLGEEKYAIDIIMDGPDKESFDYQTINYPGSTTGSIKALPEGGFVMVCRRK